MPRDRVRCIECREPIPSDARICPHCESLQPSPLVDAGIVVAGVFAFVFGVILALLTVGLPRILGFALLIVGFGLAIGGYTRRVDRRVERRSR